MSAAVGAPLGLQVVGQGGAVVRPLPRTRVTFAKRGPQLLASDWLDLRQVQVHDLGAPCGWRMPSVRRSSLPFLALVAELCSTVRTRLLIVAPAASGSPHVNRRLTVGRWIRLAGRYGLTLRENAEPAAFKSSNVLRHECRVEGRQNDSQHGAFCAN